MAERIPAITSRIFRYPALDTIKKPVPEQNEVQVRVLAVGLNPADIKLSALALSGRVCGCEWAGVVESVGEGVSQWKKDDRVAGFTPGGTNTRTSAFAQTLCAPADAIFRIPDDVTMETAASVGVGFVTSVLTLRQFLGYPSGTNGGDGKGLLAKDQGPLLIWSGATSFGMHAIQLAKILSPERKVIVTASARNHDLLRTYGADHCFDYNVPSAVDEIRKLGPIRVAIDAFGEKATTELAARCLTGTHDQKARIVSSQPSMPFAAPKVAKDVEVTSVMSYTAINRPVRVAFLFLYPASQSDFDESKHMLSQLNEWWTAGKFKPMPVKLLSPTSSDVRQAMEEIVKKGFPLLASGTIRGEKLVARLQSEASRL
jgi:NADPH:quinone reductase-like Zn-dependent oxidoreductase